MAASTSTLQSASKKRKKLPIVGYKINQPVNPEEEKVEIHTMLLEQKDLLEEQKVEIDKLLISAEWNTEVNEAKVMKICGNSLTIFGHSKNRSIYLYPEEALYLTEMNKLQLFYDDVRISIQRAYTLLLNPVTKITIDSYRIFKHFVVYGYKLFRHEKRSVSASNSILTTSSPLKMDTTTSVYEEFCEKLQIFEPVTTSQTIPENSLDIAYDVFCPLTAVQKSCRPDPDYYLVIIRPDEKIDSLFKFVSSFNRTNLLFAQVSGNSISVFNMQGAQIPDLF